MANDPTNRRQPSTNEDTRGKYNSESSQTSPVDTDDATLAPGLDGVKGMDDDATKEEEERGETTTITRLVYDEYDPSES